VKTSLDVLIEARRIISDPDRWCQRRYNLGDAYCAIGAIMKCDGRPEAYSLLREGIGDDAIDQRITDWNDKPWRTHAEVLAAFDRAIELAKPYAERKP
jgi:hypothetical protein